MYHDFYGILHGIRIAFLSCHFLVLVIVAVMFDLSILRGPFLQCDLSQSKELDY